MAILSEVQGSPQQRLQVLRVLWMAQFGSVILFLVIGIVLGQGESLESAQVDVIRPVLALTSVAVAFLSLWWRRSFAVSPSSPLYLFEGLTGSEDAATVSAALMRLQTNCVIVWAMSEAVAIFGLVLALLTHDPEELAPFVGAAVVLLILHRPSAWPVDRIVRALGPGPGSGSAA